MSDYKTFSNEELGKTGASFSISWLDVCYKVKTGEGMKQLLFNINGHVEPGSTLAIMGPSGSGKTTLLNILADRVSTGQIEGEVLVDGAPRGSDFRYQASYVPQENALFDVFTVRETIEFTADLALPSSVPKSAKRERIDEILEVMGLQSCEDTPVGGVVFKGISGGQMKRLSIALSLITDPSIVMLDEPTSGLDSSATINVVQAIKDLAAKEKTVLYSIHQPSSELFAMFDSLILLASGRTVYYGPAPESIEFFASQGHQCPESSNPADYFMTIINTDFEGHGDIDALADAFESSPKSDDVKTLVQKAKENEKNQVAYIKHKANIFTQCYYLSKRLILNSILNPGLIWVRVLMYAVIAVALGGLYFDFDERDPTSGISMASLLFFMEIFVMFLSFAGIPFFVKQQPVFVRERANGLVEVSPFVVANFISILLPVTAFAGTTCTIVYYMVGLHGFKWFFLTLFLLLLIAESFCHMACALTDNFLISMMIQANYSGLMALSQGYLVPKDDLPLFFKAFNTVGYFKYGYENWMYNQFQKAPNGTATLEDYDMTNVDMEKNAFILMGFVGLHQIIFFLLVFFKHTGKA